ncbi:hypothetical protein HYH02_004571 [Chlamydomonas schloesseri]|uniref:Neurotransmitter-gated ion-channel ligand-binding domain-containing protein n=1 Tax=Chlamydomonas schloesseri TaxID=2026947 RepID=A0A835WMW2_9CHLO|nr:hypothetical protein HYH02_004571 [Chlamydomonas schloesseri]|eukprot:KAG2450733.1 hypothetical protein HYH02_004571 [Chlamydomonas schloesseri]
MLRTASLLLSIFAASSYAQLTNPLLGSEAAGIIPPWAPTLPTGPSGVTDVSVSALLERVTAFSTTENTYHAAWWVILTWKDAGAGEAVRARSTQIMNDDGLSCSRACDSSSLPSGGCCDSIWLPHIELPNMLTYDEDQIPRYRINANATSGTVTWSTRIIGRWYSPLDFRAYPFDHQHLLMELYIADSQSHAVGLKWEHVAKLNNTAHTKGADLSGWRVKWGKGKIYDSRSCQAAYGVTAPRFFEAPSGSGNDMEVLMQSLRISDRRYADNSGRGTTAPDWCGTYPTVYDEARALYGPIVLVADIMVKRVSSYYVMTNLIPVLIISLVVFVVYFMPCNALGDRMVVIMTLFLSLTAMQFVFDFPPANYLNALQQVVLVAYVMMLVACFESLVVNRIATLPVVLTNKRTCFQKYSTLLRRQTNASAGGSGTLTRRVSRALTSAFTNLKFRESKELQRVGSDPIPSPYPTTGAIAVAAYVGGSGGASATGRRVGSAGSGIVAVSPNGGMVVRRTMSRQRSAARRAAAAAAFAAAAAASGHGSGTNTGTHTSAAPTPKGVGSRAPSRSGTLSRLAAVSGGGGAGAAAGANPADLGAATDPIRADSASGRNQGRAPASPLLPPPPLVIADAAGLSPLGISVGVRQPSATAPPAPTPTRAAAAAALNPAITSPKAEPHAATRAAFGSIDIMPPAAAASSSGSGGSLLDPMVCGASAPPPAPGPRITPFAPAASAPMAAGFSAYREAHDGGASCFQKSSSASTDPNVIGGGPWRLRRRRGGCLGRLLGCLAAAWSAAAAWFGRAVTAPDRFYQNCKEDAEFAWFVASRIDKYCLVIGVILYIVIISVLLWVQTQVGDHKMMLGDRPGNM